MALAVIASVRGVVRSLPEPRGTGERVFHRLADPDEVALVMASGELWGRPARNIYASDLPAVKAFIGPLPAHGKGYEFTTPVKPSDETPYQARWVAGDPGVASEDGWAKIPVKVLRSTTGST